MFFYYIENKEVINVRFSPVTSSKIEIEGFPQNLGSGPR